MSGESEKRFDAPPSRIAKARREGNLPRAQEFGASVAFLAAAVAICAVVAPFGALARAALAQALRGTAPAALCAAFVALALVPVACAAACGALAAFAQSGGFVWVAPAVKLERLQPVEGFKRMFSRDAVTHGARALAAFAVASLAMLPALRDLADAGGAGIGPQGAASLAWSGARRVVFAAAAVGLLFAFAEFGVARRAWLRKLRMSFAELKRELRESDGDPLARGRRKALHRSFIRGALARVKDAAFVVVNPTHVAVALEYRPPSVPVPAVLVRAAGEMALRVREEAAQRRIPVIENVPLARALYRDGEVGKPIAQQHYVAVAEIVAALMRSGALT
ncbi:MAG TPA: EscU/YscU/HrcU family type III secretion system export apparatus switch protein [Candidatus Acidoferrales bacterium]|nr:EscU/YscU/HrcU family type III secretion system export apparatus switch protein [Candidatus Acidoferrales bacterium]